MPAWPGSLPQAQFVGIEDERAMGFMRSEVDAGPAKQRRRFSSAVRALRTDMEVNGTERAALDTFYVTTVKEGSLEWTWTDPNGDATVTFRFMEPPRYRLRVGNSDNAKRIWSVTLALEILP